MDTILKYIPLPYTDNAYETAVITEQIAREIITFSHIPTTVIALVLAIYLYRNAKNLASFYLLLLTLTFFFWGYFDLLAWTGGTHVVYFGWSLLAVFSVTFAFLSYWFLYAFVKGKDLPLWQKVASLLALAPAYYVALTSSYLSDYYTHAITPLEIGWITTYVDAVNIGALLLVIVFTVVEYSKAQTSDAKQTTLLAGLGVAGMLLIYGTSLFVSTILHNLGFLAGQADNASTYALFGMPILVAFLAFLVAKHGAFGMRMLQSVGYVILLMIILFIWIFI